MSRSAPARRRGPQTQKPETCTNWGQVGAGATAAVLGGLQATAGAVEALGGIGGAPESFGATLLVTAKGVSDIAIGGIAMNDGVSLMLSGFDGVSRGSILGNAGERSAGEIGSGCVQ